MNKRTQSLMWDIFFILVGSALVAFGLAVFTIPNKIAPGGLSGVATAVSYLTGIPVGTLTLVLNVPLIVIAWKRLGLKPLLKTLAATVALSVFIDVFGVIIPPYMGNVLFSSLISGVVMGAGMALLLIRGISTGGTDLVSLMVVRRRPNFSMGQLLMLIDTFVVVFAVFVFRDIEVALYSIFTIGVVSKTIDAVQQGVDHAKVIYIVTEQQEKILERLAGEMGRGVTVLPVRGGFTGNEKAMLMTIARRSEISSTLFVVRALDPNAFTIVTDASAVYGEGFKQDSAHDA